MSRRGGLQQDNDSDEDQVLYLDHGQQPGEDNSTTLQSRGSAKEKKLPKFKALFQHKKYKGGVSIDHTVYSLFFIHLLLGVGFHSQLEDEKYDVDSSPGFSWPVAPLEKKDKETDSSQQDDLNFGKFTSKVGLLYCPFNGYILLVSLMVFFLGQRTFRFGNRFSRRTRCSI